MLKVPLISKRESFMQGRNIESELDEARKLLDTHDLLDSNKSILEQHPEHALDYSQALVVLAPKSLIRANKPKLLEHIAHISQLSSGLESLNRSDLLSQANIEWLFAYPELANDIANIVKVLSQYDALNDAYKNDLSEVKQSITYIANILKMLHRQELMQKEMAGFLFEYWRESDQIDSALEASLNSNCLSAERVGKIFDYVDNPKIGNDLLRAILWIYANLPEKADDLASELIQSIKPDGYRALTEENLPLLISHPDVGLSLLKAMAHYCTKNMLMPEGRNFLIERAHYAQQIVNSSLDPYGSFISLEKFKKHIDQLEAILIELTAKPELGVEGLKLNAEEFHAVIKNIANAENMITAFKIMAVAEIFSQANMNKLIESIGWDTYAGSDVANILENLQQSSALDQSTFDLVCQHVKNANALYILCENLSASKILSLANLEASLPYLDYFADREVAEVINNIPIQLLTQDTFDHILLICRKAEGSYIVESLLDYIGDIKERINRLEATLIELTAKPELGVEGLKLNAEEFNSVIKNIANAKNMIAAFKVMAAAEIFSQANFNKLIEIIGSDIDTGSDVANILANLQQSRVLDQSSFDLLCQHVNNSSALDVLCLNLSASRILSLTNLEASLPYLGYFEDREVADLITDMPIHLLTQETFDHILQIFREAEGNYVVESLINYIIALHAELPPEINYAQSTHAKSVHQSISISAQKLFERYKDAINTKAKLDAVLVSLVAWSEAVEDHTNTVRSCINRITAIGYTFEDPTSQISMRQLLALTWQAMHDDANRHGSLEDALDQFKKGVYQIQRGYNLDEHGNDDGSEDRPICVAGTFNKIIEQLQGIHPDVEIKFITLQTATLKLPKVIKEQAKQFLQALSLSNPEQFNELHVKIKADGLESVWEMIKPKVCDAMFVEFESLFNSKEDITFKALIEAGQDCGLDWAEILPANTAGSNATVFAGSLGAAGGAGQSFMQSNP
jgi:hypothetical protein